MDAWINMLMIIYLSCNYLMQTIEQLKKNTHNERNTYTKHINDKRKKIWKTEKRQIRKKKKKKKKNEPSKQKKKNMTKQKTKIERKKNKQHIYIVQGVGLKDMIFLPKIVCKER